MAGLKYDKIIKYVVRAKCESPLHVGSSVGGKEEVLVHPTDHMPFIQASSIAGVLRGYTASYSETEVDALFGTSHFDKNHSSTEQQSRIRFTDGIFDLSTLKMELRPHVCIDRKTGSVSSSNASGQKFDMEYVGAGAEFCTSIYLYVDSEQRNIEETMLIIFAAMKAGILRFGAKKSSGAGKIIPISIKCKSFNMKEQKDREQWIKEEELPENQMEEILEKLPVVEGEQEQYKVIVRGKTEGNILIKGLSVSQFGQGAPDSENIRNAKGDYIIPGSSYRGAIRSQMEKISRYIGKENLIDSAFGKIGQDKEEGYAGNLIFEDTIIGKQSENDNVDLRHRIHIDKFTGGVFQRGLFAEKNAVGNLELTITVVNKNRPQETLGLLLLAVRDLASKVMTLGSGYATGKGFVDVSEIMITSGNQVAKIIYQDKISVEDESGIIKNAIAALKEVS